MRTANILVYGYITLYGYVLKFCFLKFTNMSW